MKLDESCLFTCPVVHPGEEQVLGEGGGLWESPESGGGACHEVPWVRLPHLRGPQCFNL